MISLNRLNYLKLNLNSFFIKSMENKVKEGDSKEVYATTLGFGLRNTEMRTKLCSTKTKMSGELYF